MQNIDRLENWHRWNHSKSCYFWYSHDQHILAFHLSEGLFSSNAFILAEMGFAEAGLGVPGACWFYRNRLLRFNVYLLSFVDASIFGITGMNRSCWLISCQVLAFRCEISGFRDAANLFKYSGTLIRLYAFDQNLEDLRVSTCICRVSQFFPPAIDQIGSAFSRRARDFSCWTWNLQFIDAMKSE